jgi:hypothetical protein
VVLPSPEGEGVFSCQAPLDTPRIQVNVSAFCEAASGHTSNAQRSIKSKANSNQKANDTSRKHSLEYDPETGGKAFFTRSVAYTDRRKATRRKAHQNDPGSGIETRIQKVPRRRNRKSFFELSYHQRSDRIG